MPMWHIVFDDNDGPHTAIESYQFRSTAQARAVEMTTRSKGHFRYKVISEREMRAVWEAFYEKDDTRKLRGQRSRK